MTLGDDNSGPRVSPVVISEVQYNPGNMLGADDFEFIELQNTTGQPIDLTGWRLRKGIEFDFAAGTTLGPRSTLVVLSFDPDDAANAARVAAFLELLRHRRVGPVGRGPTPTSSATAASGCSCSGPTIRRWTIPTTRRTCWPTRSTTATSRRGPGGRRHGQFAHAAGSRPLGRSAGQLDGRDAHARPRRHRCGVGRGAFDLLQQLVLRRQQRGGQRPDDAAIATDKTALLPGETASLANYTSYSRGINGIMVDLIGAAQSA